MGDGFLWKAIAELDFKKKLLLFVSLITRALCLLRVKACQPFCLSLGVYVHLCGVRSHGCAWRVRMRVVQGSMLGVFLSLCLAFETGSLTDL